MMMMMVMMMATTTEGAETGSESFRQSYNDELLSRTARTYCDSTTSQSFLDRDQPHLPYFVLVLGIEGSRHHMMESIFNSIREIAGAENDWFSTYRPTMWFHPSLEKEKGYENGQRTVAYLDDFLIEQMLEEEEQARVDSGHKTPQKFLYDSQHSFPTGENPREVLQRPDPLHLLKYHGKLFNLRFIALHRNPAEALRSLLDRKYAYDWEAVARYMEDGLIFLDSLLGALPCSSFFLLNSDQMTQKAVGVLADELVVHFPNLKMVAKDLAEKLNQKVRFDENHASSEATAPATTKTTTTTTTATTTTTRTKAKTTTDVNNNKGRTLLEVSGATQEVNGGTAVKFESEKMKRFCTTPGSNCGMINFFFTYRAHLWPRLSYFEARIIVSPRDLERNLKNSSVALKDGAVTPTPWRARGYMVKSKAQYSIHWKDHVGLTPSLIQCPAVDPYATAAMASNFLFLKFIQLRSQNKYNEIAHAAPMMKENHRCPHSSLFENSNATKRVTTIPTIFEPNAFAIEAESEIFSGDIILILQEFLHRERNDIARTFLRKRNSIYYRPSMEGPIIIHIMRFVLNYYSILLDKLSCEPSTGLMALLPDVIEKRVTVLRRFHSVTSRETSPNSRCQLSWDILRAIDPLLTASLHSLAFRMHSISVVGLGLPLFGHYSSFPYFSLCNHHADVASHRVKTLFLPVISVEVDVEDIFCQTMLPFIHQDCTDFVINPDPTQRKDIDSSTILLLSASARPSNKPDLRKNSITIGNDYIPITPQSHVFASRPIFTNSAKSKLGDILVWIPNMILLLKPHSSVPRSSPSLNCVFLLHLMDTTSSPPPLPCLFTPFPDLSSTSKPPPASIFSVFFLVNCDAIYFALNSRTIPIIIMEEFDSTSAEALLCREEIIRLQGIDAPIFPVLDFSEAHVKMLSMLDDPETLQKTLDSIELWIEGVAVAFSSAIVNNYE